MAIFNSRQHRIATWICCDVSAWYLKPFWRPAYGLLTKIQSAAAAVLNSPAV